MPELEKQTGMLDELKRKLDTFNGPTRDALVALANVAHTLIELAAKQSREDQLVAARTLLRERSRRRLLIGRIAKWLLWSMPWVVAIGQLAGVWVAIWNTIHPHA